MPRHLQVRGHFASLSANSTHQAIFHSHGQEHRIQWPEMRRPCPDLCTILSDHNQADISEQRLCYLFPLRREEFRQNTILPAGPRFHPALASDRKHSHGFRHSTLDLTVRNLRGLRFSLSGWSRKCCLDLCLAMRIVGGE